MRERKREPISFCELLSLGAWIDETVYIYTQYKAWRNSLQWSFTSSSNWGGGGGGWIFDLQNHFSVETHCHTLIIECIVDAYWEDPSDANCMTNTVVRSIKCIHCNNHGMKINLPILKIIKFIPHFKTTILDEYSTLNAPYIDVKMKILRNWNVYKI